MTAKKTVLALFATALFIPGIAFADRGHYGDHNHGDWCRHDPAPAPRAGGRYELRTVSVWVDGYNQRTWVPEQCWQERRGRHGRRAKTVCKPGHYVNRWVDGHYAQQQRWVWVPYRYGRGHRS